jgi:hypothetical protein
MTAAEEHPQGKPEGQAAILDVCNADSSTGNASTKQRPEFFFEPQIYSPPPRILVPKPNIKPGVLYLVFFFIFCYFSRLSSLWCTLRFESLTYAEPKLVLRARFAAVS